MNRMIRKVSVVLCVYDDYTETPAVPERCAAAVKPWGSVLYRPGGYFLLVDCPEGELTVSLRGEWYREQTVRVPEGCGKEEIRCFLAPSKKHPLIENAAVLYGKCPGPDFSAAAAVKCGCRLAADYERGCKIIRLYENEGLTGRELQIGCAREDARERFRIQKAFGSSRNEYELEYPLSGSYGRRDAVIYKMCPIDSLDGESYFAAFKVPEKDAGCFLYTDRKNAVWVPLNCGRRHRYDFIPEKTKNELTNSMTDNIL